MRTKPPYDDKLMKANEYAASEQRASAMYMAEEIEAWQLAREDVASLSQISAASARKADRYL